MTAPDLPAGFILVPMAKGCVLVLTAHEFRLGLKRGKWWQRVLATAQRGAKRTGPETTPPTSGDFTP